MGLIDVDKMSVGPHSAHKRGPNTRSALRKLFPYFFFFNPHNISFRCLNYWMYVSG